MDVDVITNVSSDVIITRIYVTYVLSLDAQCLGHVDCPGKRAVGLTQTRRRLLQRLR